jgi:hypothetical protein
MFSAFIPGQHRHLIGANFREPTFKIGLYSTVIDLRLCEIFCELGEQNITSFSRFCQGFYCLGFQKTALFPNKTAYQFSPVWVSDLPDFDSGLDYTPILFPVKGIACFLFKPAVFFAGFPLSA